MKYLKEKVLGKRWWRLNLYKAFGVVVIFCVRAKSEGYPGALSGIKPMAEKGAAWLPDGKNILPQSSQADYVRCRLKFSL